MNWRVEFHKDFKGEAKALPTQVLIGLVAITELLQHSGPQLGRPHVDTLNSSKHANMKEIRLRADDGVWRFAFAFDPERAAIILVGGDKAGTNQKRFYRQLIKKADKRFDEHLAALSKKKGN